MSRSPDDIARELRNTRNGLAALVSRMAGTPEDRPSPEAIEGMRARYRDLEAELAKAVTRDTGRVW